MSKEKYHLKSPRIPVNSNSKNNGKNKVMADKIPKYTIFSSSMFPIEAPMKPDINGLIGKAIKWTKGIAADTTIIKNEVMTANNISNMRISF